MTNTFIEILACKKSIALRKLVCNIGINDAKYIVSPVINGKAIRCQYYERWVKMIGRCYSYKCQKRQPTYLGCFVCKDWVSFSIFKEWMVNQDWENKELDKDIIKPGNKEYSPETCCFVPKELNTLLTNSAANRGIYPQGVSFERRIDKFRARVHYNGNCINIGYYDNETEASNVYIKAKVKIILEAATNQTDKRIANGLKLHADILLKYLSS